MRIEAAFEGVRRIFLDTAPVVYLVEANPEFGALVQRTFQMMEEQGITTVASPVTLAECLVLPLRSQQVLAEQSFRVLLTETEGMSFVDIDAQIGAKAAALRGKYRLRLPDAFQIAVAVCSGCDGFLTNDRALKRVEELNVILLSDLVTSEGE
ncbi:MAG: type II toxin-antitoxin system VapC family toxin [Acaryochloridaceae cyanobacterium CSU_3_4]|nr:type II toxin-antitoxin system VapC family toxin [Acaryochloridaceae cyanobacterium CSU_3_4]